MASNGTRYAQRAQDHAAEAAKAAEILKHGNTRSAEGPALASKAHLHAAYAHLNAMFASGLVESLFHDDPRPDVDARTLGDSVNAEADAQHWANQASLSASYALPDQTAERASLQAKDSPSALSSRHKGQAIEASKSAVLAHLLAAERGSL